MKYLGEEVLDLVRENNKLKGNDPDLVDLKRELRVQKAVLEAAELRQQLLDEQAREREMKP